MVAPALLSSTKVPKRDRQSRMKYIAVNIHLSLASLGVWQAKNRDGRRKRAQSAVVVEGWGLLWAVKSCTVLFLVSQVVNFSTQSHRIAAMTYLELRPRAPPKQCSQHYVAWRSSRSINPPASRTTTRSARCGRPTSASCRRKHSSDSRRNTRGGLRSRLRGHGGTRPSSFRCTVRYPVRALFSMLAPRTRGIDLLQSCACTCSSTSSSSTADPTGPPTR